MVSAMTAKIHPRVFDYIINIENICRPECEMTHCNVRKLPEHKNKKSYGQQSEKEKRCNGFSL